MEFSTLGLVALGLILGLPIGFILFGFMSASGQADDRMEALMDRDLPPEHLRIRDRERSADLD